MTRTRSTALALLVLLALSACPGRQTPKGPEDDPGPAEEPSTETGAKPEV